MTLWHDCARLLLNVPSVICQLAVVASYESGFRTLVCFVTASMFVFYERILFHCQIQSDTSCTFCLFWLLLNVAVCLMGAGQD